MDSAPITWFTEDPTPILIAGGITLIVLLVFLLKTGRGAILYAMAGVALFMGLAVLIDKLVVTDRERIANVIYDAGAAAKRNDLSAVVAFISPSVPAVQQDARRWIGQAKLDEVTITNMRIDLDRSTNPPTATAVFRGFAQGQLRDRSAVYAGTYFGLITAHFRREGDRWVVTDYDHDP
jgi:hypothetical protein